MKIKKYIEKSFNEGKKKIIAELGDDAVILSTRNIKNPEDGSETVEIVAAIDEKTIGREKSYQAICERKIKRLGSCS